MTPEQVHRELCKLDPALQPWQNCEHKWVEMPPTRHRWVFQIKLMRCHCGHEILHTKTEIDDDVLTTFGDGKADRYSTVDDLLALAKRLEARVMIDTRFGWDVAAGEPLVQVCVWYRSDLMEQSIQISLIQALSEALLRASGRWGE